MPTQSVVMDASTLEEAQEFADQLSEVFIRTVVEMARLTCVAHLRGEDIGAAIKHTVRLSSPWLHEQLVEQDDIEVILQQAVFFARDETEKFLDVNREDT